MISGRWGAALMMASACALVASPCAAAGRATSQFRVLVNPVSSCTVSAAPLIFLIPVPTNSNVDSTSTITIKCPPNTAYTIDIDTGLHANGINRRVYNAGYNAYINYDVYKDPPRSAVWGTGGTKNVGGNSGVTGVALMTVYGRVNSVKTLKSGSYNDTLTVTVTF
ncbi:spore coat U domain-containing protein [Novosphingobium sp. Gsoil 351]|uniref:Csu type fimbrial protein n=1 Tax=Novosphingobium sp. Gsoil 351 TaxID=2675225 RepID=UPI0012B497AB|nr:spore coat U domain-containing protein [Novosphingobium sp. Gsoil 351]QGN54895.1 fimbrial major subunit CsuA/B family protein [Novosphingobium sp. Gsoil 351]